MTVGEERVRAATAELAEALIALTREIPTSPPGPAELLSPAAFARRAGLGRSSVYLALADQSIRSVKVRGRRLIPSSELERLAAAAPPANVSHGTSPTKKTSPSTRNVGLVSEVTDGAVSPPAA